MKAPRAVATLLALAWLPGCPSDLSERPESDAAPGVDVVKPTANPRVVEVDGSLYAKDSPSISVPNATEAPSNLGTGVPDESNGVCRLYAPKYPNPACCAFETGFDEARARDICGLDVYLGESVRGSCGFFFASTSDSTRSQFRVAPLQAMTPRSAASDHAARLARQTKRDVQATPVPGATGAWMVSFDDLHWAFLPGWTRVRELSWTKDSCPSGRVNELVAEVSSAREPTADEPRPMLPIARGPLPPKQPGPAVPAQPAG